MANILPLLHHSVGLRCLTILL